MSYSAKAFSFVYFVAFLVTIVGAENVSKQLILSGAHNQLPVGIGRNPSNTPTPASSGPICAEGLKKFVKEGSAFGKKIERNFRSRSGYKLISPLNPLRKLAQKSLQLFHGHPYPIMAIDEAPRAYGWARYIFGKLDDESKQLLEVEKIGAELIAALEQVKSFQSDIEFFVEKASNLMIQKRIFEQELEKTIEMPFGIRFKYPVLVRNAEKKLVEESEEIYFGSRIQFQLELNKIKAAIGNLQKETNERGFEQALLIKKLETFRHEAIRQQVALKGAPFPSDIQGTNAQEIIDQITGLYVDEQARKIKSDLSPPKWAWEQLKWKQLSAEIKSLYMSDLPKLKEGKYLKFILSLDDDEKRMLGVQNVSEKIEWYKRTKWLRLVSTVGGASTVAGVSGGDKAHELFKIFWNFAWEDRKKKEECAAKGSPDEFAGCAIEYLKQKFPKKIYRADRSITDVLNGKGEIADEEIAKEMADIVARRNKFLFGENSKNAFASPAKRKLLLGDKSSPDYREHLINTLDENLFTEQLLSDNPKEGYLAFKFGLLYGRPEINSMVHSVVNAETPEQRVTLEKALRAIQKDNEKLKELVDDLEEILTKHAEVVKNSIEAKKTESAIDKTIDATVLEEPKAAPVSEVPVTTAPTPTNP